MKYNQNSPLLPTSEMPCRRLDCQEQLKQVKKRSLKIVIYPLLVLLVLFIVHNNLGYQRWHGCEFDLQKDSIESQTSVMDVTTHNSCKEKPFVPYDGKSSFFFKADDYQNLKIKYKTNGKSKRHLSISDGSTTILKDDSVTDITVEFDVKFSSEISKDDFFINQTADNDVYAIYLIDNSDLYDTCVTIDIVIKVPYTSALGGLFVDLINNDYTLDEGLKFKELSLNTINGNYEFQKGISSGNISIKAINSSIKGTINSLSGNLNVNTINGVVELVVEKITSNENGTLVQVESINRFINIQLPSTFESNFKLESIFGKHVIESNTPDSVHVRSKSFGKTSGYYGDDEQTKNLVNLKTISGNIQLNY